MTAPLHPAALNASNVIVDMSNTQQRSTEWHREYREKNPTARKRQSEASVRHYHRKKQQQALDAVLALATPENHARLVAGLTALAQSLTQSEAADGTSD